MQDLFALRHRKPWLLALMVVIALSQLPFCEGICEQPGSFEEQFASSPCVARLRLAGTCVQTPCDYEVFGDGGEYIMTNQLFAYKVIEVFKGEDLTAGQEIPVLFWTDTGDNRRWKDEEEDLLAYMFVQSTSCQWLFRTYKSSVYFVNGCQINKEWLSLSEHELDFLNAASSDVPVQTNIDAECPVCNCRRWRLFCKVWCAIRRFFPFLP